MVVYMVEMMAELKDNAMVQRKVGVKEILSAAMMELSSGKTSVG